MTKSVLWALIVLLFCAVPAWAQDADAGYQEAMRRIEEARVSGATELDLSRLGLSHLPPELWQLTGLQKLYVYDNQLTILPPEIGQLTGLQQLYVYDNQLTILPPEIGQLSSLVFLSLRGNQLTILPPEIGQLSNLEVLALSDNQLMVIPPEIGDLTALGELYLENNPLTTLPLEIGHLNQLVYLHNPSLTFPPIGIQQSAQHIVAYLRDYEAMLMRQTIAGIAAGVGAIAGVMLAFRWRQRRGLTEKKKRM